MGLITKEVWVHVIKNQNYYENLGYKIPKRKDKYGRISVPQGTKILVKTHDITKGSHVKVDVKCDQCRKILLNISWKDYLRCVREGGEYYCQKCSSLFFGYKKQIETKLKNGKSFYQWCIENNRQDILDRWDYNLNDCKPLEITHATSKKYYFRCSEGIHKSELKDICSFTNGQEGSIRCNQCNSFAQWGIDNIGKDFLEKYWDYEKNTINPWEVSYSSNIKIYIKCQDKKYHNSYGITPCHFINNKRCSYCNGQNVHLLDSLGQILDNKNLLDIWSKKNKKSPYKYKPYSSRKVWWECEDQIHKDYNRSIANSNYYNYRCPACVKERNESFLQEKVRVHLQQFDYLLYHEYDCSIIPINPKTKYKNNKMPYDNEINDLKLIIEVHGSQHYKISKFHYLQSKRNNTTPEYELHMQQVRDRYKKWYAKRQGYEYLIIPHWTDDKDETWKKLIDNKIEYINNKTR